MTKEYRCNKCHFVVFLVLSAIHQIKALQMTFGSSMTKRKILNQAKVVRKKLKFDVNTKEGNVRLPTSKQLCYPSTYKQNYGTRGFCNWLIPNHVIIGQYPGCTPESYGPKQREVELHVNKMVCDANVRLFCSLQSEVPSQDDYDAWKLVNGKMKLPVGGGIDDFPEYFSHYAPLVDSALTLNNIQENVSYIHAPIIDLNTPSSDSLLLLLSSILTNLEEDDKSIYIHCWGGRGRAGLVGSCLLSLLYPELDPDSCLEWVQRGYDTRDGAKSMPLGLRKSPQTSSQRDFVKRFILDQ